MRCALWPTHSARAHQRELQEFFGKRGFVCLIAWDGERAIGFAEVSTRGYVDGCESRPVPFLEGLWVEARQRRKGVGRALVQAACNWARERGFLELGSNALLTNTRSHDAHRAYGFRETERVVYFRKRL
jgi:aminoglycoside 6'-N-acetyltransferase I